MHKLLALYKAPTDVEAFFNHYESVHRPLVEKVPGLVSIELTKIDRTLFGEPGNFLLAEMRFADAESFKAGMRSPENAAAGTDLSFFARDLVTVMTGTVLPASVENCGD